MTDALGWPLSPEAADFIETAQILAEPYEEDIARLTAERDAALAAIQRLRTQIQAVLDLPAIRVQKTDPRLPSVDITVSHLDYWKVHSALSGSGAYHPPTVDQVKSGYASDSG